MTRSNVLSYTIAIIVFAFVGLAAASFAHANPSYFATGVTTGSAASTSPAYMTPGTGTSTTPVYNSYSQTSSGGVASKSDSAGLLVQFTSSSTATVLSLAVEYSDDGIDWYRNYVLDSRTSSATSTPYIIGAPFATQWKFATSTIGGAGLTASPSALSTAALTIPTPYKYTRVVATVSGANGAVWMQLVPLKERP